MGAAAAALGHTQLQSMGSIAATARVRAPHVPPVNVRVTPRPPPRRTRRTRCPPASRASARADLRAGWLDPPLEWWEMLPIGRIINKTTQLRIYARAVPRAVRETVELPEVVRQSQIIDGVGRD